MTDISKCSGMGCPLKYKCWRFRAPADPDWQSYVEPPYDDLTGKCDFLMPMKEKKTDK